MLKVTPAELARVSGNADYLYRIGRREKKKDGTIRLCYDALDPLKSMQARIQCLILNKVEYPRYLQGSIKDRRLPRGQASNARLHIRKKTLISEDIKQFFPSVRRSIIFDIWQRFFRFPPVVAECLTKLTTKEGALPQGAKTSSLLANLVFWENEWSLAAELHERGIIYSRLTDDISCSSDAALTKQQITHCIEAIRTMCRRKDLHLKRQKQTIARAGYRMVATKLVVNAKTALPKEKRAAIRATVAAVVRTIPERRTTDGFGKSHRRASGQVSYLKQHHPNEAESLRTLLRDARPATGST
jgi:hypothetical protein